MEHLGGSIVEGLPSARIMIQPRIGLPACQGACFPLPLPLLLLMLVLSFMNK